MKYSKSEAKEYARTHMRGVWGAAPLPFRPDGEIDEEGFRFNTERYIIELKTDGLFVGGVFNEFWLLTIEERKRVHEIAVEQAAGRISTIIFTSHHCLKEAAELTQHAESIGADYVIILNPYYNYGTEDNIYEYFRYISQRVNIGISVFNQPWTGYSLSPALIGRLVELENVVCVKNYESLEHTAEARRLTGDKAVFSDCNEGRWVENISQYKQQLILGIPHLLETPQDLKVREYTELALKGEIGRAREVSRSLDPVREVCGKWIFAPWVRGEIPMANFKHYSELLGMVGGEVRAPCLPLANEQRSAMAADLMEVGLIDRVAAGGSRDR